MLNKYSESVSDDPSPNQESNKNFQCLGLEMTQSQYPYGGSKPSELQLQGNQVCSFDLPRLLHM